MKVVLLLALYAVLAVSSSPYDAPRVSTYAPPRQRSTLAPQLPVYVSPAARSPRKNPIKEISKLLSSPPKLVNFVPFTGYSSPDPIFKVPKPAVPKIAYIKPITDLYPPPRPIEVVPEKVTVPPTPDSENTKPTYGVPNITDGGPIEYLPDVDEENPKSTDDPSLLIDIRISHSEEMETEEVESSTQPGNWTIFEDNRLESSDFMFTFLDGAGNSMFERTTLRMTLGVDGAATLAKKGSYVCLNPEGSIMRLNYVAEEIDFVPTRDQVLQPVESSL